MKAHAAEESPTAHSSRPPPGRPRSHRHAELPDAEALLVALTLSPATYSRNRFYEMYTAPEMQRTRRRAGQLRGVVTALASEAPARLAGRLLSVDITEDGGAVLAYEVPAIGMRRTLRLRPIELSLLRYCVGRARGERAPVALQPGSDDGARIGFALQRLSPIPASPPMPARDV